MNDPRIIDLAAAPGARESWDRPHWQVYLWAVAELLFVTNAWQISSSLRVRVLRLFGADIGAGVLMRPRIKVRFPWKLKVGAQSWIGDGVWIHNQDRVEIGANAVVSQESFITTGTHAYADDMALRTRPVVIEDGAWVTTRCIVLGGAVIGRSALVTPGTVVRGTVPAGAIFGAPEGKVIGERFARKGGNTPPA